MNTIVIFNTQNNNEFEIETEATTWGQLKQEIVGQVDKIGSMKGVMQHNSTTLESVNAEILINPDPNGETIIFLSPEKVKSGK
jgi:hypothetical protein|tara:strand:- start:3033 stop:3281 length:249 start_codon:yes stop_codon:yes gene_type:complete